jgi:aryl-alcohol dehydrogenase (NADP+)
VDAGGGRGRREGVMRLRQLGRSGVKVSPLCLGTMLFGAQTEEAEAQRIIARAREQGVNFIDTANTYAGGRSEEIVGRAIRAERDQWVLASKMGGPAAPGPNGRGLSRLNAMRCVEASLRRLGTDVIDVYYLHVEDHATPLEETVRAVADMIRAGKIRYFGVSNHRAWRIAELCRLAREAGIDPPVISSPYYNALNRMPEVEQLPACGHFGMAVYPYSPIARGVLTGKYRPGAPPPEGTRAARNDKRIMETEWRPENIAVAATLVDHARARGITPGQFAIAWLLNNRLVTGAVCGPRTLEQWEDYAGALDYAFTPEDEALVDSLVPPGHPAAPGYTDPAYPLEGRQALTAERR